ncbi:MAG: arsenate reductase (glutaredoxin) [Zetaproteobacteria bacterium]|nr:MAG: arsenate reductase (glutaredoxin) [Zetaproteobacteria bacterium]
MTRIYHNPHCSKSRQALDIIRDHGIEPEIIEYLDGSLGLVELEILFGLLDLDSALDMMRIKEPDFKEAGLTKDSSNEELLAGIAQYPKLLERPIVVTDKGACIGRPPELVEEII